MSSKALPWLGLLLPGMALFGPQALAAEPAAAREVAPVAWLLQQIRIGEATNKNELISQSIYRLQKIDPDNPQLLAARLRQALRQGDRATAESLMAQLKKNAPDSAATREAAASMLLISEPGRQQLQQARLLAASGRLAEAKTAYDALFNGVFPGVDIALEYWRLVARIDGQQALALAQLRALDRQYPGNVGVRLQIAQMQLEQDNNRQAYDQLKVVAQDPAGREQAAALWLAKIQSQPVSDASVGELQRYLNTFTTGDAQRNGRQELQRQQKLLADPAWRQRMRGLALVDRGAGAAAIPALQAALKAQPDDADLLGAMGQAQSRAGHRGAAAGYFARAIQAGQQSARIGKWRSLQRSNSYWLAIENGDNALKKGDIAAAQRDYQRARALDSRDSWALIGLGDVALANKDNPGAQQYFQHALRLEPGNGTAARRLVALYQQQSPQQAIDFIQRLSPAQQRALGSTLNSLRSDAWRAEADALAAQGNWAQAAETYRRASQDAPDDVWLNYRRAGALRQAGQPLQADALMSAMARKRPDDVAQVYAYGLYLSASDRPEQALARLNSLPKARWDQDIRDLATRLEQNKIFARASALRDDGNEAAAIALLQQQPRSQRRDITLADWALARGDADEALAGYQQLLRQQPDNSDAALGRIEALVALHRHSEARRALQTLPPQSESQNQRRVAGAWRSVGEPQRALQLYRQAMVSSEITRQLPQDDQTFTQLMRNNPGDDWLKRGIRSDAADAWRQQDTTFTLEQDYSRDKGTPGISDFTANTTMFEADTPLADGKGFLRLDHVAVSAGTFATTDGSHRELFGSCADNNTNGCSSDLTQRAEGTAPAIGWRNDRWSADIGATPLGFEVVNWVGGVSREFDIADFGLTLTASRRPIASSLLSYAGARDPSAEGGKSWGGVVATGGALGISYDRGGAHGVWGDISAHQLTGKNVADNSRERLMGGYYYKLINENNRRATVGLNSMLWHYQKDLSDYSFGQGGYYSPQSYFSLALPVTWRQRTENWSYDLGGSVSWSHSTNNGQARYPVYPGFQTSDNPVSADSSGGGWGYTLRALVERRLSAHWTVGVAVDIQQAKDYTPSHGLMYLRYSMGGWQGDLDMPPQPLTPYADFK